MRSWFSQLVAWLWPKVVQRELDDVKERFNHYRSRFDGKKVLPSAVSPHVAMALWDEYPDTRWCLQAVDLDVVEELRNKLYEEGKSPLEDWGVSEENETKATDALNTLGLELEDVHLGNAWSVFQRMVPLME